MTTDDPSPIQTTLARTSAARRLIEELVARGVDTFFGIPGGPACPIFEAIRVTHGARLIESRHESGAGFAATLYQQASGKTPAVVVTSGPGITNAVTGITNAWWERVPMLVIAGDVTWETNGERVSQDSGPEGINAENLYRPITRAQIRASHARSVVSQAMAALDAAQDPTHPGPALFVVAIDRAMESCDYVEIIKPPPRAEHKRPPKDVMRRVLGLLKTAKRPLIVLGAGCRGHEASVLRLMHKLDIAFVTTVRAKGIVDERHPCSLRNGGTGASMWARQYVAQPPDVCLVLGTDLDDTAVGPTRYAGPSTTLVHVDHDARVFGRNFPTSIGITADVGAFIAALHAVSNGPGRWNGPTDEASSALALARAVPAHDEPDAANDASEPIRTHRLMADLEAAAPLGARFITDIGEHTLFALHYLTATGPGAFHVQLALGSMGSGIAGSIGLALADPSRPVICICGDGGMQMCGMEALVAMRETLPILFVVCNDARYNMVHHGMQQIFGQAKTYDTAPIDFAMWAKAFGMPAATISKPGAITSDLVSRLMSHGGPALLDVRIDPSVRIRGAGRVEALQQMSMGTKPQEE